jgi:signal transduction histidine kinase
MSKFNLITTFIICILFTGNFTYANDSTQLHELEQKSRAYYRINIDSSALFARQILLCDSVAYPKQYGFALNWIGICLMNKGMVDSADFYYQKAIQFGQTHDAGSVVDKAYLNRGINYFNQGNYENAVKLTFEALYNFESKGDTLGVAHACYNLGNAFNRLNRLSEALNYYHKAKEVYRNIQPQWSLANVYNAMGSVYTSTLQFDSAIYCLNQSITIKVDGGAEIYCASEYNNLANIYKDQNQGERAKQYYLKSNSAAKSRGNKAVECNSLHNLGLFYFNHSNEDSAIYYTKLAIELLKGYSDYEEQIGLYQLYANILARINRYDSAFYYLNLRNQLADSIKNTSVEKEILNLHKKYELSEKNNQLAVQKVQILEKDQNLMFQLLLILSLVAVVIIIGLFFYQHKKTQSLHTRTKVNAEKTRIAMDLHDHVGAELTVVSSSLDSQIFTTPSFAEKEALTTISTQVKRVSEILRESVWSIRSEIITANQLETRIHQFFTRLNKESNTHFNIENNCPGEILSPQIALTTYRIFQEALTNTYKYAEAKNVMLTFKKLPKHFKFEISDDGTGFIYSEIESNGFGLKNMNQRIESLNGKIKIDSSPKTGTKVSWQIPT